MPDPTVKFTLDVTADCETVLERYCVRFLKERGFNVSEPHTKWETVGDFKARLRISYGTVANKVRPSPMRPNVLVQRGEKNRQIIGILSNKDFDAWCVANKR